MHRVAGPFTTEAEARAKARELDVERERQMNDSSLSREIRLAAYGTSFRVVSDERLEADRRNGIQID
jgi:hypothetical protein